MWSVDSGGSQVCNATCGAARAEAGCCGSCARLPCADHSCAPPAHREALGHGATNIVHGVCRARGREGWRQGAAAAAAAAAQAGQAATRRLAASVAASACLEQRHGAPSCPGRRAARRAEPYATLWASASHCVDRSRIWCQNNKGEVRGSGREHQRMGVLSCCALS